MNPAYDTLTPTEAAYAEQAQQSDYRATVLTDLIRAIYHELGLADPEDLKADVEDTFRELELDL